MTSDLADAIEDARVEFLDADIFQMFKELLSLRLLYLTGKLKKPRAVRLRLLKTYDDRINSCQRFYCRTRIDLTSGMIIKVFLLATAVARCIERFFPIGFDLDKYPSRLRDEIRSCQHQKLNMLRYGIFKPLLSMESWRQIIAYTITIKTLEWMLTHETAHIMSGHVEITEELRGAPWASQIIESQADDFATLRILFHARIINQNHDYSQAPMFNYVEGGFAYCRTSDRINIELIAMLLAFVVVGNEDDAEFLKADLSPESQYKEYPPAAYRLWRAMNLLFTPLRTNPGMPPLKPLSPTDDGIIAPGSLLDYVNNVIGKIRYQRRPFTTLLPMHYSILKNYDRILMDNLAPIAEYESQWRARNLDPDRPPPEWPLK